MFMILFLIFPAVLGHPVQRRNVTLNISLVINDTMDINDTTTALPDINNNDKGFDFGSIFLLVFFGCLLYSIGNLLTCYMCENCYDNRNDWCSYCTFDIMKSCYTRWCCALHCCTLEMILPCAILSPADYTRFPGINCVALSCRWVRSIVCSSCMIKHNDPNIYNRCCRCAEPYKYEDSSCCGYSKVPKNKSTQKTIIV